MSAVEENHESDKTIENDDVVTSAYSDKEETTEDDPQWTLRTET